jgi:predicted DsbA family dithiol-disulfide isomerase
VAFPLHPETPEQGRSLEDLFAGRGIDIPAMLAHLTSTASGLGLAFGKRTMTFNSRRAQELGKWAEQQGCGEAFHKAVFRAYFAAGRNIALPEELRTIAEEAGLDADRAMQVLAEEAFRDAVDQDWNHSRVSGVTAVPTFRMHGQTLVGAQPYAALEAMVLTGM